MENADSKPIGLILNPKAGSSQESRQLAHMFAARNLPLQVFKSSNPRQAATRAIGAGFRTLVAAGGDGTISAVASLAIESGSTLGVLPVGTLNHFAKALQIPLALEEAVDVIAAGKTSIVDIGEVNGRVFINNSSLGLYPTMVVLRRNQEKLGLNRWLALLRACFMSLLRLPTMHVRLTTEDVCVERTTPLLFVGNNEYEVEGLSAGDRSSLTGGRLFVCIAHAKSRMDLIRMSVHALIGRLRDMEEFEWFQPTEAIVESRRGMVRVSMDGEVVLMRMPLHYRIRPASLRVLTP